MRHPTRLLLAASAAVGVGAGLWLTYLWCKATSQYVEMTRWRTIIGNGEGEALPPVDPHLHHEWDYDAGKGRVAPGWGYGHSPMRETPYLPPPDMDLIDTLSETAAPPRRKGKPN